MSAADVASHERRCRYWLKAWLGGEAHIYFDNSTDAKARCSFTAHEFHLPHARADAADAAIAHFYAHRRYGGARYDAAALKPIQIVLTSLFEDARVEWLAMQQRPGLRALWRPFFDVLDISGSDVAALLRRLGVALFDPQGSDEHAWIAKARRLFFASEEARRDPAFSRYLGNLLGNDMGQMRLQFNWQSHVVEPSYRDDHRGLWQDDVVPENSSDVRAAVQPDDAAQALAQRLLHVASVRAGGRGDAADGAGEAGDIIATVGEWDQARRLWRADWVSVRAAPVLHGDDKSIAEIAARFDAPLRDLGSELLRRASARWIALRRRWEGDDIDLDACVHFAADRRAGAMPAPRIYRHRRRQIEQRAIVLLIDASLSSAEKSSGEPSSGERAGDEQKSGEYSRLDLALAAAWQLTQQAQLRGDVVTVLAFQSEGRAALHVSTLKAWAQPADAEFRQRLAGIAPRFSTRLGAALRYAGQMLAQCPAPVRQLLVFSDGDVSDIDSADPRYLRADAAHCVAALRQRGIDVAVVQPALTASGAFSAGAIALE